MSAPQQTGEKLYQIGFTPNAELLVNGTVIRGRFVNPDAAFDWAIEQTMNERAHLPKTVGLRVEILDTHRHEGYGQIALSVPAGRTYTGQQIRDIMGAPTADISHDDEITWEAPTFYPGPLPESSEHTEDLPVAVFASPNKKLPYVPKEPLPVATPTGREKRQLQPEDERFHFHVPGWAWALVALAVIGLGYLAFRPHTATATRLCVNNLSYQRLDDSACENPTDVTSRWWWLEAGKKPAAVDDYVTPNQGTFTQPTKH